jgi:hypothetical protein
MNDGWRDQVFWEGKIEVFDLLPDLSALQLGREAHDVLRVPQCQQLSTGDQENRSMLEGAAPSLMC